MSVRASMTTLPMPSSLPERLRAILDTRSGVHECPAEIKEALLAAAAASDGTFRFAALAAMFPDSVHIPVHTSKHSHCRFRMRLRCVLPKQKHCPDSRVCTLCQSD